MKETKPQKKIYVVFFKTLETVFRHIQFVFWVTLLLESRKKLLKAAEEGRKK